MKVDIICPLYNAEKEVMLQFKQIKNQSAYNDINKIRYVITKGNDKTLDIVKKIANENDKVIFEEIESKDFSHSLTRENAAKSSNADIIVFITQDVIIEQNDWLYNLTKSIKNGECEASYSRQISKSKGIEKYTREKNYPEESKIVTKEYLNEMGLRTFFFSDASSAIRNDIFKKLNYYDNKKLSISEDMYIAYKLIMNGYRIKYEAESVVIHSHNFKFKQLYKRYYDTGVFFKKNSYLDKYGTNKTGGEMAKYVLKKILQEKDFGAFIRFWPDMIARFFGMKNGKCKFDFKYLTDIYIGMASFIISIMFYYSNRNIISAIILMLTSVLLIILDKKEYGYYTNPKGIFSCVYLFTIGLSNLRLHSAQVEWKIWTWVCIICGYLAFHIGYLFKQGKTKKNINKSKMSKRCSLILIVLISTASIIGLIIEAIIRGYLPICSDNMASYQNFSVTGIHYFTVSCALILPLSVIYYMLHKTKISIIEKIYLLIINIICITIPFLIVSRQLMLTTLVLTLLAIIEVDNNKEILKILITGLLIILTWIMIGNYRNQNEEYLKQALEINTISQTEDLNNKITNTNNIEDDNYKEQVVNIDNKMQNNESLSNNYTNEFNNIEDDNHKNQNKTKNITINSEQNSTSKKKSNESTKFMQIYMYLAMNYDNFNCNVKQLNQFYYGTKSLFPIFALTGLKFIYPYFSDLRFSCTKSCTSL